MTLIINHLRAKTHENTGNKPAIENNHNMTQVQFKNFLPHPENSET